MDDEPSKNFEDSRYGYQDARTFEPDLAADFLRTSRGNENDGSRNQWRNECCERLPKQVAHGQQIENAQRRKGTDVPEVRGELFFDGPEARGKVSMRDDDAPGLGCRPGSENDFGDIVAIEQDGFGRSFAHGVLDFRDQPDVHVLNFAVKGRHAIAP